MNDIKNLYTLEEIKAMYASNDYSAELLLKHLITILEPYQTLPAPETVFNE